MNYILNTLKPIPLKDKFFKILSKLNTLENEINLSLNLLDHQKNDVG